MSSGDQYVWIGPASGNFGVAANWEDTTTGQDPAPTHPGVHDFVTIPGLGSADGLPLTQTIKGNGASATLTIGGDTILAGSFVTGSLLISGSPLNGALVTVPTGDSLRVTHDATLGGADDGVGALESTGGDITIGGTLYGSVEASGGGVVQVGHLVGGAAADSTSSVEIGTAGDAQAGAVTLDAGQTATIGVDAPTFVNHGAVVDSGAVFYVTNVDNTGSISGAGFHFLDDNNSTVTVTNSGTITLIGNWIGGALVNNGLLVADQSPVGSVGNFVGSITGTGRIQIAAGGDLATGQVSSGETMAFTGPGGTLTLPVFPVNGSNGYGPTISGFAPGDAFEYLGTITDTVFYTGTGTLDLMKGSDVVGQLQIAGNYAGQIFRTVALNGDTVIFLGGGQDTATPPRGTASSDQYVWSGAGPGSWDAAANWTDATTGQNPAAVAPGAHDAVTINSRGYGLPQVITGTGNSASLTIAGDTALAGTFTTSSLSFSGDANPQLSIDSGYALTVNGNADASGGELNASGGTIKITGTLTGGVDATGGGSVRIGASVDGSFSVDSASSIAIGAKGAAAAGAVTVESGATATVNGGEAPSLVNHGTLTAAGHNAIFNTDEVTNTGTITSVGFHNIDDPILGGNVAFTLTNSPTGVITLTDDWLPGSVVNGGLLIADKGTSGLGDNIGNVTGGGGQIQIGAGADLTTGSVGSGQTITFTSSTGELSVSSSSLDSYNSYEARIAGFAPGDTIDFAGVATSSTYNSSTGILELFNGSTDVANFHFNGDYSGDTFHLTPDDGSTQITVTANSASTAGSDLFHFA